MSVTLVLSQIFSFLILFLRGNSRVLCRWPPCGAPRVTYPATVASGYGYRLKWRYAVRSKLRNTRGGTPVSLRSNDVKLRRSNGSHEYAPCRQIDFWLVLFAHRIIVSRYVVGQVGNNFFSNCINISIIYFCVINKLFTLMYFLWLL